MLGVSRHQIELCMPSTQLKKDFQEIMKKSIGSSLVPLGFHGRDLDFIRNTNDIVQVFAIVKHEETLDKMAFSFQFGFYCYNVYKIAVYDFNHEFPKIRHCIFFYDLENFTKNSIYNLDSLSTVESLVSRIKNDINNYVLPIFNECNSFTTMRKLVFSNNPEPKFLSHPYGKAVYQIIFGDRENGSAQLKSFYNKYNIRDSGKDHYEFYVWDIKRIAQHFSINLIEGGG